MRSSAFLALCAFTTFSLTYAAEKSDWWQFKPFKGSYLIYSGSLGEEQPPTAGDRKISFSVKGSVAKDMFESMSPDAKETCSDDKGHRERYKGNLSCVSDPDGYVCHFGFNLRTGASISGASC